MKRVVFNRLMLRRRDRVVGVGNSVRQALIDNEGIRPNRVDVIYNGVNVEAFSNSITNRTSRFDTRREIDVGDDDLLLIQVARLDALKDHLTAIRTLARVVESHPEVKLVLVGEGPEQDVITAEVRKRSLQSFVRFLGLRNDIPRLLQAADIFLLTSISEGIPLTIIEAMLAGLPVVTTSVGGIPEIVKDGETGLTAPSGKDQELSSAILRLIETPSLREEMGAAGCRRAKTVFSDEQMNRAYHQLYNEMLTTSNAG